MTLFLTRSEATALRRSISMLQVSRSGFALSLLLGVGALGSAIALGGTAAWLIARASQQPPVMYLTVAATAVRLFGISRALARYLSRLASHKVALAGMDSLRGNLYDRLCEAPSATLTSLRRGDLMTRAGADVDEVGNVVVKTLLPSRSAPQAGTPLIRAAPDLGGMMPVRVASSVVFPMPEAPTTASEEPGRSVREMPVARVGPPGQPIARSRASITVGPSGMVWGLVGTSSSSRAQIRCAAWALRTSWEAAGASSATPSNDESGIRTMTARST